MFGKQLASDGLPSDKSETEPLPFRPYACVGGRRRLELHVLVFALARL